VPENIEYCQVLQIILSVLYMRVLMLRMQGHKSANTLRPELHLCEHTSTWINSVGREKNVHVIGLDSVMKKCKATLTGDEHFFHIAIRTRKLCRVSWLNWFFQVQGVQLILSG